MADHRFQYSIKEVQQRETDVLIIGSGPAATAAAECLGTAGAPAIPPATGAAWHWRTRQCGKPWVG